MGGSSKRHKKDREVSSRRRSRSRSPDERPRQRSSRKKTSNRNESSSSSRKRRRSTERDDYHSDSSDVVEIIDVPPAPAPPVISKQPSRSRSSSPMPDGGAGDCLSISETNKLRAKLGLKPLEVGPKETPASSSKSDAPKDPNAEGLSRIKDDWGEFYHKPATNISDKTEAEKLRDRLKEKKEKRAIEGKLRKLKTLGESDSEDDINSWVDKNRKAEISKKEAAKRAKMLDEMDQEFIDEENNHRPAKKRHYKDKDLKGLRIEHNIETFSEGKQVILTLKDQDILEGGDDTLINVNIVDDERYKKNIENKKQNPQAYGYDVYDEGVDEFGQPLERNILKKYDEEIDGDRPNSFVIGESKQLQKEQQRKLQEIKAKLQNKRLESLDTLPLTLASEYYNEEEMTTFKKPKKVKKVKKLRAKLKADDLLAITGDTGSTKDLGSRNKKFSDIVITDDTPVIEDLSDIKVDPDEDLEQVLAKARRLKQKEALHVKSLPMLNFALKPEIKTEHDSDEETAAYRVKEDGYIVLNSTAEFCRTLGDIPTYGMAGNRDESGNDLMDLDVRDVEDTAMNSDDEERTNQWSAVNPDDPRSKSVKKSIDVDDVAILDEEPDVASGVAAALKLARSKGYLEQEDTNRPSNTRFAHLQAQHYSIEDKSHAEDDKYSRRDRFSGPLMDFKEKSTFQPNVKLEYIDDNGHILNSKEAFRYLSHKFHGKGPGKNKVEKRLKKNEQEGLMKKMSSTDTPLNTLSMLQLKQKETQSPYVVLSGSKQLAHGSSSIGKNKR